MPAQVRRPLVDQGRAPPTSQAVAGRGQRVHVVAVVLRPYGAGGRRRERQRVDVFVGGVEAVAGSARAQQHRRRAGSAVRFDGAAQVGDVGPHRHLGARRGIVAPQGVHQRVDGHDVAGLEGEHAEQGALAHRAELQATTRALGPTGPSTRNVTAIRSCRSRAKPQEQEPPRYRPSQAPRPVRPTRCAGR